MKLKIGSFSLIGGRKKNEDSLLVDERLGLFAVADGVGGGYQGNVASKMVIERVHRARLEGHTLRKGFDLAQSELIAYSRAHFGDALMGTTLTAIEMKSDGILLVHIGDSRAYSLHGLMVRQLTEDHEAYEESMKNPVLSEYLGMPDELVPLKIQAEAIRYSGLQRFLLCTDGLHRQLTDQQIASIIGSSGGEPQLIVQAVCQRAAQMEDSDNVTAILLEVEF